MRWTKTQLNVIFLKNPTVQHFYSLACYLCEFKGEESQLFRKQRIWCIAFYRVRICYRIKSFLAISNRNKNSIFSNSIHCSVQKIQQKGQETKFALFCSVLSLTTKCVLTSNATCSIQSLQFHWTLWEKESKNNITMPFMTQHCVTFFQGFSL